MTPTKEKDTLQKRPPVVVVLGHVDHGKTTLLDFIRKANVAKGEAGGITQSIGAYQIEHGGKKITFIDTPGHEAFSNMRRRGTKIADIAVLVVAADDGVQPQTKESIKIVQEAKIPFVVAINKVDKEGIDVNKVKNELTAENVLLEGYGGNVSHQAISAKTGQGVGELLDLILLAAELEDLSYKPEGYAKGIILESKCDSRHGIVATGIIKEGTLKVGNRISAGGAVGKIKGLENSLGKRVKEALPSDPVRILGFEDLPQVGEEFLAGDARVSATGKTLVPELARKMPLAQKKEENKIQAKFILKADVSGSLEALYEIVKSVPRPKEVTLQIINQSVGEITDGDVQSAIATGAMIIGFRSEPTGAAKNLTRIRGVQIATSEIVYDLVKILEDEFKRLTSGVVRGELEILAVFGKKGGQQIVGGRVVAGAIENNAAVEIGRRGAAAGKGKIVNLQQNKKDAQRVEAGGECGLLLDSEIEIKEGDHIIIR